MRNRLTKQAVSLSVGGRDLPLEADFGVDVAYDHEMVGKSIEVSNIADGGLRDRRDKKAEILGVITRFGQIVAYKVKVAGKEYVGPAKDFYVDRSMVEDIQPPTATSVAVREGLSHWSQQRDYWHTQTDGLEAMAFALASVTPAAIATPHPWGWDFSVPEPMHGDFTQVRCIAYQHNNFWTVGTTVAPIREGLQPIVNPIEDHWARVYYWTYTIAEAMAERYDWPWAQAARGVKARALATAQVLVPLLKECLNECLEVRREITGTAPNLGKRSVSIGFSSVRLKPNTIGLTEPPTDRRPYTVISIDPAAAKNKRYLRQVVLHECIHIAVANGGGGPPHNDLFHAIAERVGLDPKHRD